MKIIIGLKRIIQLATKSRSFLKTALSRPKARREGIHSATPQAPLLPRLALTPRFCRIIAQPSNLVFMTGEVGGCVKICGDSLLLTREDSISDGLDGLYFCFFFSGFLQFHDNYSEMAFLFVKNPVSHSLVNIHISFLDIDFPSARHFTFSW